MKSGTNIQSFKRQVMFYINEAQEFPDLVVVVYAGKKYWRGRDGRGKQAQVSALLAQLLQCMSVTSTLVGMERKG